MSLSDPYSLSQITGHKSSEHGAKNVEDLNGDPSIQFELNRIGLELDQPTDEYKLRARFVVGQNLVPCLDTHNAYQGKRRSYYCP